MKKYVIEVLSLSDIEWNEDVAYSVERPAYLVKRASDDYPMRQFDYDWQAIRYCDELNELEDQDF